MAVLAVWLRYVFNRLWQKSLASDAAGALHAAVHRGLQVLPSGFGASVNAAGVTGGRNVRIRWSGGVLGERCAVWIDGRRQSVSMIRTEEDLQSALGLEE